MHATDSAGAKYALCATGGTTDVINYTVQRKVELDLSVLSTTQAKPLTSCTVVQRKVEQDVSTLNYLGEATDVIYCCSTRSRIRIFSKLSYLGEPTEVGSTEQDLSVISTT